MGRGKAKSSLALIEAARQVLQEIQPASVRAVCYRLFTMGLIENMSKAETNKVSTQLTWARENSIIPWEWIVDESRQGLVYGRTWDNPRAFLDEMRGTYRRDRWTMQPEWVEVWSEKATLNGTLAPVLFEYGVVFRVWHGFSSSTALHGVATQSQNSRKTLTVLYCGDWDPSGMFMSEADIPARLREYGAGQVRLIRLALTKDDTKSGLPDFPAKETDTRFRWFVERYGRRAWELDALSPAILRERLETAILELLDLGAWHQADTAEAAEQRSINEILSRWPGISGQAPKYDV